MLGLTAVPLLAGRLMAARMLAVVLALGLAIPASAGAQSRTHGSPLAAEPNINLGCETKPALGDDGGTGTYYPTPSNTQDCTWRQSGVFGVTDYSDGRTSSMPATGRVINVAVKSGANPAVIRFVIVRELAGTNYGGGGGSYCCYFVTETVPVQPRPPDPGNTSRITNFVVNLPVFRGVQEGVLVYDHIGISGVSGTGSLPLHSTGRNNAFQYTEPGSVNVGFWYPRLGGLPNDEPAGRREEGMPGMELLIRWTWCPAGQTCTPPPGQPVASVPDRIRPVVTQPRATNPTFRVDPNGRAAARRPPPRGTRFTYRLSEAARVTFTIESPAAGRKVGKACVKPTARNRSARACTRWVKVGSFFQNGLPGANTKPFSGKIGRRTLSPGSYRASITAKDAAGNNSAVVRLNFRVVR
jgi:hypothetical protein